MHHTPAGGAVARRGLLRLSELGQGWAAGSKPAKVGRLTCGVAAPTVKGAVETGSAVSPTYRAGATGPFVSQTVYVYSRPAGASLFWRHVVGPQALSCLATSVAGFSTKNVTFKVTRSQALPAPHAATRAVAYRVVGTAVSTPQKVTVYVDVVLLLRGNAIAELGFSSFSRPVASGLELRLARVVAARL